MDMIFNIILLAASGSAVVYCIILNKKLDTLKNTEKGLGVSIASMSKSVEHARSTISAANDSNTRSLEQLKSLIEEANDLIPTLNDLTDVVSELTEVAVTDINEAAEKTKQSVSALMMNAKKTTDTLREEFDYLDTIAASSDDCPAIVDSAPDKIEVYIDDL